MIVKYVNDCHDDCFTLNKEYEATLTSYGELLIIDDTGEEHIIALQDNEFESFEEDDFFRCRFVIL